MRDLAPNEFGWARGFTLYFWHAPFGKGRDFRSNTNIRYSVLMTLLNIFPYMKGTNGKSRPTRLIRISWPWDRVQFNSNQSCFKSPTRKYIQKSTHQTKNPKTRFSPFAKSPTLPSLLFSISLIKTPHPFQKSQPPSQGFKSLRISNPRRAEPPTEPQPQTITTPWTPNCVFGTCNIGTRCAES